MISLLKHVWESNIFMSQTLQNLFVLIYAWVHVFYNWKIQVISPIKQHIQKLFHAGQEWKK